jgi:hypothetical protein
MEETNRDFEVFIDLAKPHFPKIIERRYINKKSRCVLCLNFGCKQGIMEHFFIVKNAQPLPKGDFALICYQEPHRYKEVEKLKKEGDAMSRKFLQIGPGEGVFYD